MTYKQIGYVRGLLAKNGLDEDDKEDMVMEYTDGRTKHLSDMTQPETQLLIKALGGGIVSPKDKMVRKILSMAHEMSWEKPGTRDVDMDRVNAWTVKYKGKKLDDFSAREMTEVVTTFEKMYNKFLNAL